MHLPNTEKCHEGKYHVRVEEMDGTYAVSSKAQVAVAVEAFGCITHQCTADEIKSLPGEIAPSSPRPTPDSGGPALTVVVLRLRSRAQHPSGWAKAAVSSICQTHLKHGKALESE